MLGTASAAAAAGPAPRGQPIRCLGKVHVPDGALQAASVTVGDADDRVTITDAGTFDLDRLHDQFSSAKHIFERDLAGPVIGAVANGQDAAILCLGSSRTPHADLLPDLAAFAVADLIRAMGERGDAPATLEAQFVEIADDTVRDLFAADARVVVLDDGEWGATVSGARRQACSGADLRTALADAYGRRTRQMTEFGPVADRSTLVLIVEVTQRTTTSGYQRRSRLTIADLPSVDRLAIDPAQLRASEGLALNRQLVAFGNVIGALADPARADFANFDEAKTTALLREALSANVMTTAIGLIDASDPVLATTTLRLMQTLRSITTFPIGNDERPHGLLRRLRLRLAALRSQQPAPTTTDYSDRDRTQTLYLDEKAKLIAAERARADAVAARHRLTTSLNDLKERYRQLLDDKTKVQEELVVSEEERLRLAQALIDTQMQESLLKEAHHQDRYAAETKLLAAEAETVELRAREQRLTEQTADLQRRLDGVEAERQALALEYVALRQNYDQAGRDQTDLRTRNETLGFELLTLVNVRKELEERRNVLQEQTQQLEATLREAQQARAALDDRVAQLDDANRQLRADNDNLSLMSLKKDVELRQAQAELEARRLSLERAQIEWLRQAEADAQALRQTTEKEAALLTQAKAVAEEAAQRAASELKAARRQLATAEAQLAALTDRNVQLEGEIEQVRLQLGQQSEQYRARVLALVEGADDDALKQAVSQLADEHARVESHQRQELDAIRARERLGVRQLRKLMGIYRDLSRDVADGRRDGCRILSEDELRQLGGEVARDEDAFLEEVDRWKLRCQQAAQQTATCQQELIRQAEDHRRQVAGLRKEIDEQGRAREKVTAELQAVSTAHSFCGLERSQGVATEVLSAIRKEMEAIRAQIANQPSPQVVMAPASRASPELEREVRELREQIRAAKDAEDRVLREPPKSLAELEKERAAWAMKCARLEAQLTHLQDYLKAQMAAWDKERSSLRQQLKKLMGVKGEPGYSL